MERQTNMKLFGGISFRAVLLALAGILFYGTPASAQEGNGTMKAVFAEVKSELKNNDMLGTILMIVGVIAVVGIAMWLSFRTPSKSLK